MPDTATQYPPTSSKRMGASSDSNPFPAEMRERADQTRSVDHSEGSVARMIEDQTAKLPSDLFLWAALGSIGGSLLLQVSGRSHDALFVGQWAPTFLLLGLYNKIVKVAGSDARSPARA